MNEFDIPILKKTYDLYRGLSEYRRLIPKKDRFTTYERVENSMLQILSGIFKASSQSKKEKLASLEEVSVQLNLLRIFIRLMKDMRAIDNKKYTLIQSQIDEIGRMLGGWIRSVRDR